MIKLNLSEEEELLMKKVCELQLTSFERILTGEKDNPIKEKLIEQNVTEMELNSMIKDVVKQYSDIQLAPDKLFHDHSDLLSNFREALDFNTHSLPDFSELIPHFLTRLDLAIYILRNRN